MNYIQTERRDGVIIARLLQSIDGKSWVTTGGPRVFQNYKQVQEYAKGQKALNDMCIDCARLMEQDCCGTIVQAYTKCRFKRKAIA